MLAALTGLGLSAAAGLNAYIPLLVVGVLANFFEKVRLPTEFSWLSSWWALSIIAVLLIVELVVDKVPVIDSVNDTIQTIVRPASGGVVFSASQAAAEIDSSTWMAGNPWLGWLLGIITALIVHATKVTARPVVNATTGGVGGPVVSTAEDAGSIGLSLLAIFIPVLVVIALIGLGVIAWKVFSRILAIRRKAAEVLDRERRQPRPLEETGGVDQEV